MRNLIQSAVFKLTMYYLAIIVGLSLGFSLFLYHVSSNELDRGLRRPEIAFRDRNAVPQAFEDYLQNRLDEAHAHLVVNLLLFNLFILVAGGLVSYFLAQQTLDPIDKAVEAQSRFTADASHELRTPLTAMQTEIEVALRHKQLSSNKAKALLESNLEEVRKLRLLADNLLKLARTGDQGLNKTVLSLEDIAIEAMDNVVKSAQAKKITIENNAQPLKVWADKAALAEALNILLDNAIKYSPHNRHVTVTSQKTGNNVVLAVQDQGPGIAKDDLPHIFDRFYRSDQSRTTAQQADGHGLGLSIAQQLIQLHGGHIAVTSTVGKGSTFAIHLPAALPAATSS